MVILIVFIWVMNVIAYYLYRIDKRRAEQSKYRIPEAVLLTVSFLGGAFGAFCAMHEYHHKTLHTIFAVGVPIALAIQTVMVIWTMVYCLTAQ